MALVKETGSIVPDANTYVDREGVIAYAAERGIALPNDDTTDALLIKAMDYLTLFDTKWKGALVAPGVQTLAWPRKNAYIDGTTAFPSDEIPYQLLRAQAELAIQVHNGVNLLPTMASDTAFIKREKVDVIETEYSEAVALKYMGMLPEMPLVEAMLVPLFGTPDRLYTVRV